MQKSLVYRFFTLFMAVLVLTSSVGVGLVEKQCSMRGKTVDLVFKEKKKGCKLCRTSKSETSRQAKNEAPVFKKSQCCTEKQELKNVEFRITTAKQLEKPVKDLSGIIPFQGSAADLLKPVLSGAGDSLPASVHSFTSRYFGRSMLSFVQSFLI